MEPVPDYRILLKETVARGGLSLRSFAEKVGVSSSYLSEVFRGKKSLSVELAFRITVKLELTEIETQRFCLLVQLELEKDPFFREELAKRLHAISPRQSQVDLSADLARTISEWHHAAILELTYLPGFSLTAENVAEELQIPRMEAELAIARLLRIELLERDGKGRYRKSHGYVFAESKIPSGTYKKFHRGVLGKTVAALGAQSPQERVSATDIFAIDRKYLPQIDRLSREFSKSVFEYVDKSIVKDSVYALSVHCVRLTENGTP